MSPPFVYVENVTGLTFSPSDRLKIRYIASKGSAALSAFVERAKRKPALAALADQKILLGVRAYVDRADKIAELRDKLAAARGRR